MAEKNILPTTNRPRHLFAKDLQKEVISKIEKDHQIILMGNFNLEYEELTTWMLELGWQDLIRKSMEKFLIHMLA